VRRRIDVVHPLAEVGREVQDGDVAGLLREHVDDIVGFLLSFAVIARLWLAQHRIVSGLVRQSPVVVLLLVAGRGDAPRHPGPGALHRHDDRELGAPGADRARHRP
jgi:hypothetical protein